MSATQPKPRRRKPSQNERLLAHARAGGVLDQNDWWTAPTPDGGPPIKALRTRVSNLEALGCRFRHEIRPRRLARYVLLHEPTDVQPQQAPPARVAEGHDDDAGQLALAPPRPTSVDPVPHWMDL